MRIKRKAAYYVALRFSPDACKLFNLILKTSYNFRL